jgi:hypothetical protein
VFNHGAEVAVDDGAGIYLSEAAHSGSDNHRVYYKAAPATPYAITALVMMEVCVTTYPVIDPLGWRDSVSGKLEMWTVQGGASSIPTTVDKWTNATTNSSHPYVQTVPVKNFNWYKIRDDGTNVYFYTSVDGVHFQQWYTEVKSAGFLGATGYNQVWFGLNSNQGTTIPPLVMKLLSWTVSAS